MRMTFRWYGENNDNISLQSIKQVPYIKGIITSLLDVPAGELWELEDILKVKAQVEKAGLTLDDIGMIELNEAFAAQSLAVIRELGLDMAKVNVSGGAIAMGHPLGATGGRILTTLVHGMKRTRTRYGIATLCMGGGQGGATLLELAD